MKRFLVLAVMFVAWAAGISAEAMSLGVRTALWGVASVRRQLDGVGLSDAVGAHNLEFETGGDAEWFVQSRVTCGGATALQSGSIRNGGVSWVKTTAVGPGTVTFWWKSSCEEYDSDVYDYAYLSIDGVPQGTLNNYRLEGIAIGGQKDWTNIVLDVTGEGAHTIRWTYCKDDVDDGNVGEDCIWLDEFSFIPKPTISFDIGMNATGNAPASMHAFAEASIALPDQDGFDWADHVFSGWTDGANTYASGAVYTVPSSNVTLTAIWIAKRLLTFTLDDGEGEPPTTIKDIPNATVTLPSGTGLQKAKHTFIGWNDGTQTYEAGAEYIVTDSSVTFTAIWAAKTLAAPVITSADVANGGTIETASATIEIAAENGTSIYYAMDGTEPTTNSALYTAPFTADSMVVTIKAFAVRDDYFDSNVAEFNFTRKPYSAAECLNADGKTITTGGADAAWVRVLGESAHDGVAALRSGEIGDGETSTVEMAVVGAGQIAFLWKVSSERETVRPQRYDYVSFLIDGEDQKWLGGEKDWTNETFAVVGDGLHTFQWIYQKNNNGLTQGDDCAWLDEVIWTANDPLPDVTSDAEVGAVLTGAGDEVRLKSKLTTVAAYRQFRTWVDGKGLAHSTVAASPNAWFAYALDVPGLMAKATPISGDDIAIESVVPSCDSSGAFDLVIGVAGAEIGEAANLAEVFGVEGAAELNEAAFAEDGLSLSLQRTSDGKAKATVTIEGAPPRYFLRVKMK